MLVSVGIPYTSQVDFFRAAAFVIPIAVFFAPRHICRDLARSEEHPLREWTGTTVERVEGGEFSAGP